MFGTGPAEGASEVPVVEFEVVRRIGWKGIAAIFKGVFATLLDGGV